MRRIPSGITILLILLALASRVTAGTPYLQVYFDYGFSKRFSSCPSAPVGTVAGTIHVVAHDFDAWLNAIEFRIDLPPQMSWFADIIDPDYISIGNSPEGIAIAFPVPLDAFAPVEVARVFFLWMCQDCNGPVYDIPVCVDAYPSSGFLRAVRWPDLELIYGTSGTAGICVTTGGDPRCKDLPIPVEQTTWGRIKTMYR